MAKHVNTTHESMIMRRLLIILALILPLFLTPGSLFPQSTSKKTQKKEIPASKLPDKITKYISANLPSARITKAVKQKRKPEATYTVYVTIKTKSHTLIFDHSGVLVNLDGKKLDSTVLK